MYSYKYPHPYVTTDCVIFGLDGTKLQVLPMERSIDPYKGKWPTPKREAYLYKRAIMN